MPRKKPEMPRDTKKGLETALEGAAGLALPGGGLAIKALFAGLDVLRGAHQRSRHERERRFWTALLREGIAPESGGIPPEFEQDFATVYQFVLLDEEDAKADYGAALLASIVNQECDAKYRILFMKILGAIDTGAIQFLKMLAETWEDSRRTAPDLAREMEGQTLATGQVTMDSVEFKKKVLEEYNQRVAPLSSAIWHAHRSDIDPLFLAYRSALARYGLLPESREQEGTRPMSPPSDIAFLFLRAIGVQFIPQDGPSDPRWQRITSETVLERNLLILVRRVENSRLVVLRAVTGGTHYGTVTVLPEKRREQLSAFEDYRVLQISFSPVRSRASEESTARGDGSY